MSDSTRILHAFATYVHTRDTHLPQATAPKAKLHILSKPKINKVSMRAVLWWKTEAGCIREKEGFFRKLQILDNVVFEKGLFEM